MAQLRQDYQKFVEADTEVIAVGPEDAKSFARWWHDHKMQFVGIPDPKHEIAKLYTQRFNVLRGGRLPALMVIDKEGKLRLKHYGDAPRDIPSDNEVLALLAEINSTP